MATRQGYYAPEEDAPAEFVLKRVPGKDGSYLLMNQFRYVHVVKGRYEEWVVPDAPGRRFETDLASIPSLAGWLVPKDGRHTPAALVHDAMILGKGETHCYKGRKVSAREADEIFRQAMQFLGVKFLRRWLMWAAVSILTLWRAEGRRPPQRVAQVAWLVVGLVAFSIVGLFLLPDVLDFPELGSYGFLPASIPLLREVARWDPVTLLWRIDEGPFLAELNRFLTVVVAAAAVYALVWARRWRFGLCVGLALPLIAWPMAVGAVSYAVYWTLELVISVALLLARSRGRDTGRVPAPQLAHLIVGDRSGGTGDDEMLGTPLPHHS